MKIAAIVVALIALLVGSVAAMAYLWRGAAIEISLFGWIVIGAGSALSIGLGVGLMALSFLSARRGFDERAHQREPGDGTGHE